jgi:hypothetical protein
MNDAELGQPIYGTLEQFESHRMPEAVRAAALANAVALAKYIGPWADDETGTKLATRVMHVATMFEAYLTGEEADDPTD